MTNSRFNGNMAIHQICPEIKTISDLEKKIKNAAKEIDTGKTGPYLLTGHMTL